PPVSIAAPSTSNALPTIDPTSDALTTSCRPSASAKAAMISSGALPNVTLTKPPTPGPVRAARCSVAAPIRAAAGTTPRAEVANTATGEAPASLRTSATGMNAPNPWTGHIGDTPG